MPALAYWAQEERLGGLSPRLLRLLASVSNTGSHRIRHLKIGSVIVREYQGRLHEVTVVPVGFCWPSRRPLVPPPGLGRLSSLAGQPPPFIG